MVPFFVISGCKSDFCIFLDIFLTEKYKFL